MLTPMLLLSFFINVRLFSVIVSPSVHPSPFAEG